MASESLATNPITFTELCLLLNAIRKVPAKQKTEKRQRSGRPKELVLVEDWIKRTRLIYGHDLPRGTVILFFRLFFPEHSVRRRYGLKEQTLSEHLEIYFKLKPGKLGGWCQTTLQQRGLSSGNLGAEVEKFLRSARFRGRHFTRRGSLTLGQIDTLLDELASLCKWSAEEVRTNWQPRGGTDPRSIDTILKELLDPLQADEIAFMIQIILRDISPLLYPPPTLSASRALTCFNTLAHHQIQVEDALRIWDPKLPALYKIIGNVDILTEKFESWKYHIPPEMEWSPEVGVIVQRPASVRPGTCDRTTTGLSGDVACETKYDGERLQIHINVSLPYGRQIQIYSKSGRDSTEDRALLIPAIRAALGLDYDIYGNTLLAQRVANVTPKSCRLDVFNLIIEGEMVPYNEAESRIDEFWTLSSVKHGTLSSNYLAPSQDSIETGHSGDSPPNGIPPSPLKKVQSMHLMVVWFDVLLVNDESLLHRPYRHRREMLEKIVRPIDGFSIIADSKTINFDDRRRALKDLRLHFAQLIVARGEGLMLKPLDSTYHDPDKAKRWIKLKKDFIPGAGDTKDFHVVGASWQIDRGRSLGVPPSVFTTFFIGLQADDLGANLGRNSKRHFHILFSTSYGLDREALEKLCHDIRESNPVSFDTDPDIKTSFKRAPGLRSSHLEVYHSTATNFTFSLTDHLQPRSQRPTWIFRDPRIFELTGAGFQRNPDTPFYALRWPRITKHNHEEGAPLDLRQLQETAALAMKAPSHDPDDKVARLWAEFAATMGQTKSNHQIEEVVAWLRILEEADGEKAGLSTTMSGAPDAVLPCRTTRPSLHPLASMTNITVHTSTKASHSRPAASQSSSSKQSAKIAPSCSPSRRSPSSARPASAEIIVIDDDGGGGGGGVNTIKSFGLDSPLRISVPLPRESQVTRSTPPSSERNGVVGVGSWRPPKRKSASPPTLRLPSSLLPATTASTGTVGRVPKRPRSISQHLRPSFPPLESEHPLVGSLPPLTISSLSPGLPPHPPSYFWSFYPSPPCPFVLPTPRNLLRLSRSNYLVDAQNVLWVCGYTLDPPRSERPNALANGRVKGGVVFVDCDERLQELKALVSGARDAQRRAEVWVVHSKWVDQPELESYVFAGL